MNYVFSIVTSNIIELCLFTYYYRIVLSLKKPNKILYIVVYSSLFLIKCLFNFFFIAKINIAVSFSIYLLLIFFFSQSNIIYKILSLGIYFGLSIFAESLTYHIFSIFFDWKEHILIQMLSSKFVLLIFILFIKYYKTINDEDSIDLKSTLLLSIQPISIIFFIYITNGEFIINSQNKLLIILSLALLVFSNFISLYIFEEIIRKNKIEKELDFEKERTKENDTYYQYLKESIENFKAYRHDLRHHFGILKSMLYAGKNGDAKIYIDTLVEDIIEVSDKRSGDEFLDLVLSSRWHKIKKMDIHMVFEIRKINLNQISKLDLNIIYGNIIDNAIESCSQCEKRSIKIETAQINDRYQMIKITNSCHAVNVEDDKFKSMNQDSEFHGYGLANIQKTVEKYGGYINFSFHDDKQVFQTILWFDKEFKKEL